jgi:hypothetical protein
MRVHYYDARPARAFRRTFRLGAKADATGITASLAAGVLTITVPHKTTVQKPAPRVIPIRSPCPPPPPAAAPPPAADVAGPSTRAAPAAADTAAPAAVPVAASCDERGAGGKGKAAMVPEQGEPEDGRVEDCEY